jgi:hypothetical protein
MQNIDISRYLGLRNVEGKIGDYHVVAHELIHRKKGTAQRGRTTNALG